MNEFMLNNLFDAVNEIKNIPPHLFDDWYSYLSFDVESLFANVPIKRTIDIILKRICVDKVICIQSCCIQNLVHNFGPNLRFTVDLFQNYAPHFLYLELSPNDISIFRKNTNTDLYTHFSCYVPSTHQTAWIKSLTFHASCICSLR